MSKQKKYCYGETTDTQRNYEEQDILIRKKWNNDFKNGILKLGIINIIKPGININNNKKK